MSLNQLRKVTRRQLIVGKKYTVMKRKAPFSRWTLTFRGYGKDVYPQFKEYHDDKSAFFGNEDPPCNVYTNLLAEEWLYYTDEPDRTIYKINENINVFIMNYQIYDGYIPFSE